jgi:hypothetical protein
MVPHLIEQDFRNGKATYETRQFGFGGQNILKVGQKEHIVIFGYEFSPAGGGFTFAVREAPAAGLTIIPTEIRTLMTQQVSFYNGQNFYPFVHHVPAQITPYVEQFDPVSGITSQVVKNYYIDPNVLNRDVYIPSDVDVAVTVGLLTTATRNTAGTMPATGVLTPVLTYGGSGQIQNVQTDISGALIQYLQPGVQEFNNFGFGLIPANASQQSFGVPAAAGGLEDPTRHLTTIGATARDIWASNYLITIHYASYSTNIPDTNF